jgi:hypothetical protein
MKRVKLIKERLYFKEKKRERVIRDHERGKRTPEESG